MVKVATVGKSNSNLRKAAKAKQDEFYTQLSDIEAELKHYKKHFKDKIVYCNCDDPMKSKFWVYFYRNFQHLGLKKLITTCYKSQDTNEYSQNNSKQAICIEYLGNISGSGKLEIEDVKYTILKGDGDFRSEECITLLKQADIVVTNPPFSLFREYVAQLVEHEKKFLIVGNLNAITYKEIFKLIKDNKLWVGVTMDGRNKWFQVPDTYPIKENVANSKTENGKKYLFVNGCLWYTNIDISKRHEDIILYKTYTQKDYPKYDNYDAINVNKVKEIPTDYTGIMGVPITFLNKYNPDQFTLLGIMNTGEINEGIRHKNTAHGRPLVNGKELYLRILIKRK